MNNYLILRSQNSPYNDVTKSSVLSFADMDDNLIFLKGHAIYTATTNNGIVTLKKYNGEDITFSAGTGGGTGSDTYWISGSTGTNSIKTVNSSTIDATGNYSLAEGFDTTAIGDYSHAEGYRTIASGTTAHAEGDYTIAGGLASHAEGYESKANGDYSHAEGETTIASGNASHAEGVTTKAQGNASHAEGSGTIASGDAAHAEGDSTIASGNYSHAGGSGSGGSVVASGITSFAHQYVSGGGQFGPGNYGAYGDYSTILGGQDHFIQIGSESGAIMGGNGHLLFGISLNSGIFGGNANLLIDTFNGVVLGGDANGTIQADNSAVIAGYNNLIDAYAYNGPAYGFIGGGTNNKIQTGGGVTDESSVIMGGNGNLIEGDNQYNGIYNSFGSTLTNQDTSTIIGSYESYINDNTGGLEANNNAVINASSSYIDGYGISHANILGGAFNTITQTVDGVNQPNYTSILNGYGNQILDSDTAVIFNGFQNIISDNSKQSTILNGQNHSITSSKFSAIIGGNSNEMTDSDGSALIGGSDNIILSDGNPAFTRYYNAIIGGTGNTINNSELSFILGGYQNVIPYGKVGVVILGGDSITGVTNNTVYVQRLNIKSAVNDNTTSRFLTLDANNNIAFRNLSSISGATSGGTGVDTYWASGSTGSYSLKQLNDSGLDATANYSVAINNATMADGINSFAAGYSTWARGLTSTAIGENTEAFGNYSFAGGHNAKASGTTSFIWSTESTAFGDRTVVLGGSNIAGNNSDTVYVPYLNIQSATTDNALTSFLVRNGDGSIKTRTLNPGTPFYLHNSPTTDAGSDKTSLIQRNGGIFIGDYVASSGTGSFTYVEKSAVSISHTGYTYFNQNSYQNSPNDSGSLGMYRQRGTPSAPLNLLSNDKLGDITFTTAAYGISGGSQSDSFIGVYANENHSGTTFGSAMGTRMDFYLIPNGTTSTRKALTIIGSGDTRIFGNLTASTVSATTYYNLPNQPSVTGFTYSNNNLTIKQSNGDLNVVVNTMTGLTINGNLTYTGQTNNPVYTAGTVTATHIPNWNNSNVQQVILSATTTNISGGTNIANGAIYTMILKQNATGSRLVTWASQYKWQSGIAPVLTSIANGVDILTFISDGTNLYGLIAKDFR